MSEPKVRELQPLEKLKDAQALATLSELHGKLLRELEDAEHALELAQDEINSAHLQIQKAEKIAQEAHSSISALQKQEKALTIAMNALRSRSEESQR